MKKYLMPYAIDSLCSKLTSDQKVQIKNPKAFHALLWLLDPASLTWTCQLKVRRVFKINK